MQRILYLLLAAALPIACAPQPSQPTEDRSLSAAATGWNVLLISVDTLRADRLNSYGYQAYETSPRMDALLKSGTRFESASATRALTWPSLASVLTGLYPTGHGVTQNGYELPEGLPTLPTILSDNGYRTAAYLSNMCRAGHRGWNTFRCSQGRDHRSVQWALEWATSRNREAPFLLWVHLFGAHGPYYNGGERLVSQMDPDYQGTLLPKKWRLNAVMKEEEVLDARDQRHLNAIYDAAVLGTDGHIQRLLDGLQSQGALEKTIVVFLADHGEDLYQHHGYIYHACSVYESSLHVPLGFSAPGLLPPGTQVKQAVELSDVAPTLLDLLGLPMPENLHGSSLRPYLERPDRGGEGKPAFSEYGDSRIHTVRKAGWKLVDNPESLVPVCLADGPPGHYPIGNTELYHLPSDPLEQKNLSAVEPAKVAELQELIHQRFSKLRSRSEHQEIPEDLRQELHSLGYAGQ